MSIVFTELNGEISAFTFCYDNCESIEQIQNEINDTGGKEKVVGFIELKRGDSLANLISILCSFGDSQEGSLQVELEKFLAKVFIAGRKKEEKNE